MPALAPSEAARFRTALEDVTARLGGRPTSQDLSQTHLYFRWAYELATHPAILDAVEGVLARGRDDYHHFELLPAPPALSTDAALTAQQAEARRLLTALRNTTGHYAADDRRHAR